MNMCITKDGLKLLPTFYYWDQNDHFWKKNFTNCFWYQIFLKFQLANLRETPEGETESQESSKKQSTKKSLNQVPVSKVSNTFLPSE